MKKRNNLSVYLLIFFGLVLIILIALIVKNKILMSPLEPGDRCIDSDGGANFIAYGEVYYGGQTFPDKCVDMQQENQGAIYTLSEQICGKSFPQNPQAIVKDCRDIDGNFCCEQGKCQTCSCVNECEQEGERRCIENQPEGGGGLYQICGQYDNDECLEWGSQFSCPSGEQCINGECVGEEPSCDLDFCYETDEGNNMFVRGINYFNTFTNGICYFNYTRDDCLDENTLIELIGCDGESMTINCPNGCFNDECTFEQNSTSNCGDGICDAGEDCIDCPVDCECDSYCKDYENGEHPETQGQVESLIAPLPIEYDNLPDSISLSFDNRNYEISVLDFEEDLSCQYCGKVRFSINGEETGWIKRGELYQLSDGNYITSLFIDSDIIGFYMRNSNSELKNMGFGDTCLDDWAISEISCRENFVGFRSDNCVQQCTSGACLTCYDSDSGQNPNVKGYTEAHSSQLNMGEPEREFMFYNQTQFLSRHNISFINISHYEGFFWNITLSIDGQLITISDWEEYQIDEGIYLGIMMLYGPPYQILINVYTYNHKNNLIIKTYDFCNGNNPLGELYCSEGENFWQHGNALVELIRCPIPGFCELGRCEFPRGSGEFPFAIER